MSASAADTRPKTATGRVDRIEPDRVAGWAHSPDTATPVVVDLVQDGQVVASGEASGYRKDLAEAGYGDGLCSFAVAAPEGVEFDPARLQVFVRGVQGALPRSRPQGAEDPTLARIIELEDSVEALRDRIVDRLQRIEQGLINVAKHLGERDGRDAAPDAESVDGLRQAVEQVEGYLTVGLATRIRNAVDESIDGAVARQTEHLRRRVRLWGGLAVGIGLINLGLLAALIFGAAG